MQYQTELPSWADFRTAPNPLPEGTVLWSGKNAPPSLGEKMAPTLNGWDGKYTGKVVGYSTNGGWLGIILDMEALPDWRRKESPNKLAYFAGCEGF